MFETLSLTGELIERTSSAVRVQEIVQLSLAPVFLLAAIGAVLNVMNARLIWIVDRVNGIERLRYEHDTDRQTEELPALLQRQNYAELSVNFSTAAALTICLVIGLLFISAFIRPQMGTVVAILWIITTVELIISLTLFLMETRLATASARDRRKRSREIREREARD
ncbi:MAG: DUF2721 domain-containing protein [Pontixanthobacter sp.]